MMTPDKAPLAPDFRASESRNELTDAESGHDAASEEESLQRA
jgi:hypothetical protein